MSIFVFYEALKKGISGIYFLHSKDYFMLQEALNAFMKKEGEDLTFQLFDMAELSSLSLIIEAIKTPSFFGSKAWTVLKRAEVLKLKNFKTLAEEIGEPSTNLENNILFLYKGSPQKEVYELFKDARFISVELPEKELPRWIKYKAQELGLALNDEVIEYILELTEGESAIICSELQKLEMAGIKAPSIEYLREVFHPHTEYDIKDLFDALKRGDQLRILYICRSLEEELPQVIGALNKFYSTTKVYKKALPLLHEMDLKARVQKESVEPLLIKLLEM